MVFIKLLFATAFAFLSTGCALGPNFTNGQTTLPQMKAVLGEPIDQFSFADGITRIRWARTSFHGSTLDGTQVNTNLTFYDGEFGGDQVLRHWRATDASVSLRNALGFNMPSATWQGGYVRRGQEFPPGSFLETCATGGPRQVQAAISSGADAKAKDGKGQTTLMAAAHENQDPEVIAVLISAGADVNAKSANSSTALIIAAEDNNRAIAPLVAGGADVNARNSTDKTPLWLATWNNYTDGADALIKAGADSNLMDVQGLTPLMVAALRGGPESIELLVKGGANVNAKGKIGTAIQLAVINNRGPAVVGAIVKAGADVNAANAHGKTVLDFAREKGNAEVVKILIDAGAK